MTDPKEYRFSQYDFGPFDAAAGRGIAYISSCVVRSPQLRLWVKFRAGGNELETSAVMRNGTGLERHKAARRAGDFAKSQWLHISGADDRALEEAKKIAGIP